MGHGGEQEDMIQKSLRKKKEKEKQLLAEIRKKKSRLQLIKEKAGSIMKSIWATLKKYKWQILLMTWLSWTSAEAAKRIDKKEAVTKDEKKALGIKEEQSSMLPLTGNVGKYAAMIS